MKMRLLVLLLLAVPCVHSMHYPVCGDLFDSFVKYIPAGSGRAHFGQLLSDGKYFLITRKYPGEQKASDYMAFIGTSDHMQAYKISACNTLHFVETGALEFTLSSGKKFCINVLHGKKSTFDGKRIELFK